MTAKTRTGLNIADATGADEDSTHSQLMKDHRRPGRAEGASIHSMGDTRDDAGNADADMPIHNEDAESPSKGERESDIPDESEHLPQGEGPDIDDEGDGLGPPSGHGD
jgi:hypothetical protein